MMSIWILLAALLMIHHPYAGAAMLMAAWFVV